MGFLIRNAPGGVRRRIDRPDMDDPPFLDYFIGGREMLRTSIPSSATRVAFLSEEAAGR